MLAIGSRLAAHTEVAGLVAFGPLDLEHVQPGDGHRHLGCQVEAFRRVVRHSLDSNLLRSGKLERDELLPFGKPVLRKGGLGHGQPGKAYNSGVDSHLVPHLKLDCTPGAGYV